MIERMCHDNPQIGFCRDGISIYQLPSEFHSRLIFFLVRPVEKLVSDQSLSRVGIVFVVSITLIRYRKLCDYQQDRASFCLRHDESSDKRKLNQIVGVKFRQFRNVCLNCTGIWHEIRQFSPNSNTRKLYDGQCEFMEVIRRPLKMRVRECWCGNIWVDLNDSRSCDSRHYLLWSIFVFLVILVCGLGVILIFRCQPYNMKHSSEKKKPYRLITA